MAPIFIRVVKIVLPTTYISLERKFYRINIILSTRVQKWTYFELLIENRKDIFLKVVGLFIKNRQHMKK